MFSNLSKTSFGTTPSGTSFGLGSSANPTGPWGNTGNTQLFGKPTTSGFGQQSTTSFGQTPTSSNSMFPFFPHASTPGFGSNTNNQSTFGSNIFGQQQQPTTNALFGSNTFGQQKPNTFGFGTQNQQQPPNLFGQSSQPQTSLFQPTGSTNLFGSGNTFGSSTIGSGTNIKFNPVTGTDTMQKGGVTTSINTKHHCITCMKEYEGKSLEELRLEDYQANRRGPQTQFGSTPFGGTPSMFGQPTENKPAFGQSPGFGQMSGSTFGQQNQTFGLTTQQPAPNIFGKTTVFGAAGSTTTGFGGFNTAPSVTNAFAANQNKPFGGSTTTPLFGSTQPQQQTPSFGSTLFGQNNQNTSGSFFNKPAQTTGFGTGGFGFSQTPATTTNNLFQQSKPVFGLGQTTTGAFSQTPGFGQTNQQSAFGTSTFGKPTNFGQNQNTFQSVNQTSLFTNTQQKPGSLIGGGIGGGLFGTNAFNTNNTSLFGVPQSTIQPQVQGYSLETSQDSKSLNLLASNQFGHAPFLTGLLPIDKPTSPTLYTTNPMEIKKMLESSKKLDDTSFNAKLRLKLGPPKTQRDNLFEEGNDEDVNKFYKLSCKRLVLKNRQESKQSIFEANSICNELTVKNSEISLISLPSDNSRIYDAAIQKNRSSEESTELSTRKTDKTNFEFSFMNRNFDKLNSNKSNVQTSSTAENEITSTDNLDENQGNTIGRMEKHQEEEEAPNNNSSSVAPFSTSDTETVLKDPLTAHVTSEISKSDSSVLLSPNSRKLGPSGIILNRAEYYTLPPIEELDYLVSQDGRCMVKGFTVGRRGYGNVYFPDEINVKNLNLDDIVHFRYKEIHMYPDESKKPTVGEGLNRRAQVTLDRVYPRVKETKEIIDNVDQVLAAKFPEQLVEISTKHGLKFIDYRPETGSWVFMVEHFSKYGFTESDEEDCELTLSKQAEKINMQKAAQPSTKLLFSRPEESDKLTKSSSTMIVDSMDLVSEYTDESDQREGDVLHKSMTIDLEGNEECNNRMYEPTDQDLFYHSSHIQLMKATFFSDSECASTVSSMDDIGGSFKPGLIEFPTKVRHCRQPQRAKAWKVFINIASRPDDTLLLKASRCYSDLGIFKGKSFKVGWFRGFENYIAKLPNSTDSEPSITLSFGTLPHLATSEVLKKSVTDCIELAQKCSEFSLDNSEEIPTFKIITDRTFLRGCYKIFKNITPETQGGPEVLYRDVWSLCNALWGPGRRSVPFVKSRLSSWLKIAVQDKAPTLKHPEFRSTTEILDVIFNHLSCFNIKEAAEMAMSANMPVLSLIIAQMHFSQKPKALITHQIKSWYSSMHVEHISPEFLKIYLLLSGSPFNESVSVCEGLDWKRAFGLHLWYFTNGGSPLQAVIDDYTKGFSCENYAVEPNPCYETADNSTSFDILYHILQLYKNPTYRLAKALNPSTYTYVKTDYQLSWLLLLFFQSVGIGLINEYEETLLHTSFSTQLEDYGLWDLAILPLLYLGDNFLKKKLILGILNRNLSTEDDEESKNIETKLKEAFFVPDIWIDNVKAEKRKNNFC
ncbi:hypothetical protein HHI36_023151 [Cryptolaemus montrouzieri]|uniref:Nuclear pore complex protein Nup98-Nup96 n=1 Tax=Cryptolaemus montrouzieri TaxID=559131 RepID=A0ABD2PFJ3_9CUCU